MINKQNFVPHFLASLVFAMCKYIYKKLFWKAFINFF